MTWTYDITSRFHEPIAETARPTRPGGLRPRGPPTPSLAGPHGPRSAPAGAPVSRLAARGESPGRAAAVRGDDGKWGQTPFSRGVSTEEKMGSDPISLQRHFRHGLLARYAARHNEYKILAASRITG